MMQKVEGRSSLNLKGPLVSILLLGWNHERYIEQCIESIGSQRYRNIEVLFLDNNSSDATYEKGVGLLEATGLPFQSFQNKEGKSIARNLNFLFSQSKGEYIIPLSTDDWLTEDCVIQKVTYYEEHPGIGMLYSHGWIYFEDQKKAVEADPSNYKRGKFTRALFLETNVLFFIGICYKRPVLEQLGGWDEQLLIEDLDMFLRISLQYDIDFVPHPLAYYRKVSSSAANNVDFMVKGWEQYYQKYKSLDFVNMDAWLAEKYRAYASVLLDRGEVKKARQLFFKALKKDQLNMQTYKTLFYLLRKAAKWKSAINA